MDVWFIFDCEFRYDDDSYDMADDERTNFSCSEKFQVIVS
jgi:hypothetical protein